MRSPAISIAAVLVKGRVLETILNTEQGVASCGSGSQPLPREVRDPARRALRPGREELAVTDPDAIPVREARDRSPAPRQAPGLPRYVQAPRVPRKHPYDSRRSAHPFRGCVKRQSKTRAQKTRRGNENGCLKSEYGSAALLVLILRSAQLERFRRLERTYARLER